MSARHTPGPWSAEPIWDIPECRIHAEITPGRPMALAEAFEMHGVGEKEANARLIAAAPELLEALQKLDEKCEESDEACYGTLSTTFVRDIVRAAIAKAEGRS